MTHTYSVTGKFSNPTLRTAASVNSIKYAAWYSCGFVSGSTIHSTDAIGQNLLLQIYSHIASLDLPPVNLTAVAVKFLKDAFTSFALKKLTWEILAPFLN